MKVCVFDQLQREWEGLADDRRVAGRLAEVTEAAGGATTLAGVEQFVRRADPSAADRALVPLVARAVEDDRLAARVALQLLLPGVRRLARTWWALGDRDERSAAAVAATYHRICRYPLARRPGRVAANVLMDAAGDLRRAVAGDRLVTTGLSGRWEVEGSEGGWEPSAAPPSHPALELADVLRDAVSGGVLSAADAELIAVSRIEGTPLADLARRRNASPRTLQWRRRRAEAALVTMRAPRPPAVAG